MENWMANIFPVPILSDVSEEKNIHSFMANVVVWKLSDYSGFEICLDSLVELNLEDRESRPSFVELLVSAEIKFDRCTTAKTRGKKDTSTWPLPLQRVAF